MRDAIGGVVNITFIAVFMLVVSGYLAFSVSYNKAYKVKNKIISTLEQYEGYNDKSKQVIQEYIKEIGYNVPELNSRVAESNFGSSRPDLNFDSSCPYHCVEGYCVKWFPNKDAAAAGIPNGYYHVVTMVDIDVPIFNKFIPFMTFFQTSGDTMTINKDATC